MNAAWISLFQNQGWWFQSFQMFCFAQYLAFSIVIVFILAFSNLADVFIQSENNKSTPGRRLTGVIIFKK